MSRNLLKTFVLAATLAIWPGTQLPAQSVAEPPGQDLDANLYTYRAVITSVYDGDTVTADIDLGMKIWLRGERLRLWGIDTPELNRGTDRKMARQARDFLRSQIIGRKVIIKTVRDRRGKYGRYLATIYRGDVNINELMVLKTYAKRYMAKR